MPTLFQVFFFASIDLMEACHIVNLLPRVHYLKGLVQFGFGRECKVPFSNRRRNRHVCKVNNTPFFNHPSTATTLSYDDICRLLFQKLDYNYKYGRAPFMCKVLLSSVLCHFRFQYTFRQTCSNNPLSRNASSAFRNSREAATRTLNN